MVPKKAVTKQDSSPPPAQWMPAADAFNAAVAQCVQDGEAEAVHRVRTGSRRLQAMLDATLRENPALEQPARAWLRQLKKIRRAAGEVRDLDVHRKMLEKWVGHDSPESGAETLDAWLKSERKHLAHAMQKQIGKQQEALAKRQAAFTLAIGSLPLGGTRKPRPADAVALEEFVRANDSMPLLDAENLHDFRKATKKARYVAESGAQGEANSSVATALKRIQDAIGDWHDWLCLWEEAKTVLGQRAPDLTTLFERQVERHFSAAMKTTQTMRGRLLGEWMASRGKRPSNAVSIGDRHSASGF